MRLSLLGELDHASAGSLLLRLEDLKRSQKPVRLDLSRLEFIDSSGVRAVVVSIRDARRDTWPLYVDRRLSSQVEQVFGVLGLDALLWPEEEDL